MKPDETYQRVKSERRLGPDGYVEEMVDSKGVMIMGVEADAKGAKEDLKRSEELLRKAQDCYDAVSMMMQSRPKWEEHHSWILKQIEATRQSRFALEAETRNMMLQFKEVREFFLSDAHTKEVDRLKEFVGLCERLKALKDSGFLDAIADTILQLSEPGRDMASFAEPEEAK
jgi:hypothetical protein